MDYRIITTEPGTAIETIHHAQHNVVWNHANATHWAHTEGRKLPDGTHIAIDRRGLSAMYQPHRRYVVENGITRRTDRPTTAPGARKPGKLARASFRSLLSWESAVSAVYGGVYSSWPAWAKDILRRERGYV